MTWSPQEALDARKDALRWLLDKSNGEFRRSIDWVDQKGSGVPDGTWSLLYKDGLLCCFAAGSERPGVEPSWRLTLPGWIEACQLLRVEVFSRHGASLTADGWR